VRVDCGARRGPVRGIWTSFGYDEINWTYTPAGRRALKVIGDFVEQPYYVRSHYIFTIVNLG
jgi:xylan 1,4-beta-xylosidase